MAVREKTIDDPLRRVVGAIKRQLRPLRDRVEVAIRRPQDEGKLAYDAQAYWRGDHAILPQYSHWRGTGVFDDDERWVGMGQRHLELYRRLARMAGKPEQIGTIVEWGCGGGANAVPFAGLSSTFVGVDVSRTSLDECGRQLAAVSFQNYVPVEIDVADPERVLDVLTGPADLFLCTYVFEMLPSVAYGYRLLRLARRLLAEDGTALIQIKCTDGSWETRPRPFSYRRNVTQITAYALEQFWIEAQRIGFMPLAVALVPHDEFTGDVHYAYLLMVKDAERASPEASPA
jgi:Methyltransferase domain